MSLFDLICSQSPYPFVKICCCYPHLPQKEIACEMGLALLLLKHDWYPWIHCPSPPLKKWPWDRPFLSENSCEMGSFFSFVKMAKRSMKMAKKQLLETASKMGPVFVFLVKEKLPALQNRLLGLQGQLTILYCRKGHWCERCAAADVVTMSA